MKPAAFLLALLILIIAQSGCRKEKSELEQPSMADHPSEVDSHAEKILAKIGKEAITTADLELTLKLMGVPERTWDERKDRFLANMVEVRVFSQEARRLGLDNDPKIRESLEKARDETLSGHFVRKVVNKEAEPSDEEIKERYLKHKEKFVFPESVFIQNIQPRDQKEAEEILKALKVGESFEKLAKKRSIAPSWKDGGRLGWVFKGRMDPELEKVAFNLEKGVLSDLIKTKKGYEIIKVLDKRGKHQISFEEAKGRIRTRLQLQRRKAVIEGYYEKAEVERHPGEDGVLVKIGDELLSEEDLAPMLAEVPDKDKQTLRKKWIDHWIRTKVFSNEAKKARLDTVPEVAMDLRRKADVILATAFRKEVMPDKVQVSDKEILDYYESHREDFRVPAKVRVKSILVKSREEAEEILEELAEKGGAYFIDLAMERSLHPKASRRGGEIGWFARGEKDPALEEVAFSLKKGQISDIIKTKDGYEIIKFMDKKGGNIRTLDEVRKQIEMKLIGQKFEEEKQRYFEKAKVKVLGA